MNFRLLTALLAIAVIMTAANAGAAPAPWSGHESPAVISAGSPAKITRDTPMYIVELDGEPAATYGGGTAGFSATSPITTGAAKLDSSEPATAAYVDHLLSEQGTFTSTLDRALGRHVEVLFNYRFVLNGVAVVMSAEEAELVRHMPGVKRVTENTWEEVDTDAGPAWIGAPGIWDGSSVPGGVGTMGEGVIVGVLDTGINMDHPSFAAVGGDGYVHENPFGDGNYKGWCDPEHPNHTEAIQCNAKLIGLWSFEGANLTPEDDDGHGSHTASTAAGNFITASFVTPTMIITTPLQGVAPHANIIAYDVCLGGGCAAVATTAGIDQAADDGVDVTNYSIGTSSAFIWSEDNPVMTAYRNLRAAGIAASVSAGNNGPGSATTAAVGPWMAAVGASTHNRVVANTLEDMSGGTLTPPADIIGRGLTAGYGPATIVYAEGYTNVSGNPDDGGCMEAFPPGTFTGQIVICDRGVIGRVQKGLNVLAGGAGGLVLANTVAEGDSMTADAHALPAVHITYDDATTLKAWLAGGGSNHVGTIGGARFDRDPAGADIMAGFSSRGPTVWNNCCIRPWGLPGTKYLDVLKPDVDAPGVDIFAAAATDPDDPSPEPEFQSLSGTSMSSPHVAGALALMRGLYPEWTPAQVQSALMLTAVTEGVRKEDGATPADPFDIGAGRINVSQAAATGIVLEMTMEDAMSANPDIGGDPATLNLASMANFHCAGGCAWSRTIQSVWDEEVTWNLSTDADEGLGLTVTPESITLAPGASGTFTVTADTDELDLESFAFGQVMLETTEAGPSPAHLPVAVRAQAITFPPSVQSELPAPLAVGYTSQASGTWELMGFKSMTVDDLTATAIGFSEPEQSDASLPADPTNDTPYDASGGTTTTLITVPDGALRLVGETKSSEAPDIDMFMGIDANGDGLGSEDEVVCVSAGGSWEEYCDIRNPIPGNWWMIIQNWTASAPDAIDDVSFYHGYVAAGGTTMSVIVPSSVEEGVPWDLTIGWDLESIEPGDVFYGVALLSSDGTGSGDVMNLAFDLLGVEAPGSIYLPDTRNAFIAGETP